MTKGRLVATAQPGYNRAVPLAGHTGRGGLMDLGAFFTAEFAEHTDVVRRTEEALAKEFAALVQACTRSLRAGGKLILFGNGGSAADAQHLATELTIRYKADRPAIAALALTTDSSALTAAGNDLGFEQVFARQLVALGKPGDVAIGISTSGRSPNVLTALRQARGMQVVTVGFSGKDGGDLRGVCDHLLIVPSDTTARIQEMHILLGQMLCGAIEIELGHAR
jgi:D-sedoheptulose 7-phosphate isomerase